MELYQALVLCALLYLVMMARHYFFALPSDNTIYIEDQKVTTIRNDDRVTIYEHPPKATYHGQSLSEVRLHRCFYSRVFHCSAPDNMQIQILVFLPDSGRYLYPNTHLFRLSQTSPINMLEPQVDKYPLFKKAEYIEIPIIGQQSFVIPRGWWVFIDSPSHILTKTF